nr:Chain A, CYCLIC TRYPSIN INHIBITOR [Helianthus annuus]1SFI_I Chain I, Trypsin inhibitor 1 [Helianthus annuus]3P8F_I Chain I, Trypsin inhibitor 1 [Helianthus annuus]4K8Y_B Chain B, Trypsin inhibitor 1 [Helianthus annuus]
GRCTKSIPPICFPD